MFKWRDQKDEMHQLTAVHLVTSTSSITPVRKTDESKALGHIRFSVLSKENSRDSSESLKHIAKFLFFSQLGNLVD